MSVFSAPLLYFGAPACIITSLGCTVSYYFGLWGVLGRSGGPLGSSLGSSRIAPGSSGRALGSPWAAPGALGELWGALGSSGESFGAPGGLWGSYGEALDINREDLIICLVLYIGLALRLDSILG